LGNRDVDLWRLSSAASAFWLCPGNAFGGIGISFCLQPFHSDGILDCGKIFRPTYIGDSTLNRLLYSEERIWERWAEKSMPQVFLPLLTAN